MTTNTALHQINDAGLALIKSMEGCRLAAYQDIGGIWTIGYGHISGVRPGQRVTQAEAEALLRQDLAASERDVAARVTQSLTDNQFAALVSFVFNVGPAAFEGSTLLRLLNAGDHGAVPVQLARWNHVKGQVCAGLTRRRAAEAALWSAP